MRSWSAALGAERQADAEHERRQVRRELRIEDILGRHRLRRVRERGRDPQELLRGIGRAPGPEERPAEVELRGRAARMRGDEPLQGVEAARRPARERSADLRVDASGSARRRRAPPARLPCRRSVSPRRERARLGVAADAEVERQRRHARPRLRHRSRASLCRLAARLEQRDRHGSRDGERGRRPRRSRARVPAPVIARPSLAREPTAIFLKVMPSYRDLLAAGQGRDRRGGRRRAPASSSTSPSRRSSSTSASRTSGSEGHIPGAVHVPRGNLESRIERAAPDRAQPIVVYCAGGTRSAFAAKTLEELGYENVVSLAGGFTDWKRNGFPTQLPARARRREALALQPPPADPRGRRRGPAEAARRRACC